MPRCTTLFLANIVTAGPDFFPGRCRGTRYPPQRKSVRVVIGRAIRLSQAPEPHTSYVIGSPGHYAPTKIKESARGGAPSHPELLPIHPSRASPCRSATHLFTPRTSCISPSLFDTPNRLLHLPCLHQSTKLLFQPQLSSLAMASYADMAAKGPKQTPEEAAAPPPPEISVDSTASTSSLVDVDMPSVHTVPHDFLEQEIQTETQADRVDREEKARAEADLAKKKAASKARKADSWLKRQFSSLSDGTASALVVSNLVGVVGLSAFLGYKAWGLYERGRLSWQSVGLGLGILGVVGLGEGIFGSYLYKTKGKK
ncbi:uncharacterized protein CLUP02_15857 [Colletotrichum lupini]|uniref:Mitochondrial outer membrane protein OM14 C-terminal domain-containing protein n=8 Tax=Colletotrichum acutatum species complex TaxID=2707335 RepID=A0A9Q8T716_9PEZI|nr:uncharacterized protein CLUP02_15857 [Colletotrichum lupini]UQC90327.1 hypothetical protein CLUP02_15857 [Colletotrichum lupini]